MNIEKRLQRIEEIATSSEDLEKADIEFLIDGLKLLIRYKDTYEKTTEKEVQSA